MEIRPLLDLEVVRVLNAVRQSLLQSRSRFILARPSWETLLDSVGNDRRILRDRRRADQPYVNELFFLTV